MKKLITIHLLCAALLLVAIPALAAGPDGAKGQVRMVTDSGQLEKVRSGPAGLHVQKMAEDLRRLSEAHAKGLPMPELATASDRQPVQLKNGLTAARLGADQLHYLFVGIEGSQPVAACVESGAGADLSRTDDSNPWPES